MGGTRCMEHPVCCGVPIAPALAVPPVHHAATPSVQRGAQPTCAPRSPHQTAQPCHPTSQLLPARPSPAQPSPAAPPVRLVQDHNLLAPRRQRHLLLRKHLDLVAHLGREGGGSGEGGWDGCRRRGQRQRHQQHSVQAGAAAFPPAAAGAAATCHSKAAVGSSAAAGSKQSNQEQPSSSGGRPTHHVDAAVVRGIELQHRLPEVGAQQLVGQAQDAGGLARAGGALCAAGGRAGVGALLCRRRAGVDALLVQLPPAIPAAARQPGMSA